MMIRMVGGWVFLLVLVHHKTVVVLCVCLFFLCKSINGESIICQLAAVQVGIETNVCGYRWDGMEVVWVWAWSGWYSYSDLFRFNRIVARRQKITKFTANRKKNLKIEYNRQQANATMRYKHTVDYDVAHEVVGVSSCDVWWLVARWLRWRCRRTARRHTASVRTSYTRHLTTSRTDNRRSHYNIATSNWLTVRRRCTMYHGWGEL